MADGDRDDQEIAAPAPVCAVCGATHQPGDRFCPQCGTPLTPAAGETAATARPAPTGATPTTAAAAAATPGKEPDRDTSAWIFAAPPGAVAGAGVFLLVLAALLLAVGQLDATGTIVMLSFCAAPLGLIVIAIGLARFVLGKRG